MTSHVKDLFVPAADVHWLTPFYDPAVALLTRERAWRPRLVNQIGPRSVERILDLGCGTGTLTAMLRQACPEAEVVGLDIDRDALRIARAKVDAAGTRIRFWQGRVDDPSTIPMFRFASFDKVVSALLFHHLTTEQKFHALTQCQEFAARWRRNARRGLGQARQLDDAHPVLFGAGTRRVRSHF